MAAASKALARLSVVAALLAAAPVAAAQDPLQRAADGVREDRIYVDPAAELAGQVDAEALHERIDAQDTGPIFIAVLPERATAQSPGRTLIALRTAVGETGTYALAVGDELRTLSAYYDAGPAGEDARAAHPDDLQAALLAFIDRTATERADAPSPGAGAIITIAVLGLVVVAGGLLVVSRRRARSRDGRSEVGELDPADDFVRLGDGIRALELDITLGEPSSAAKADYDRAVDAYDRANAHTRRGEDDAADRALDEGLAAIASARERLAGRR